ncbi:hypothetical protein HW115_00795 [Verrucomicrobiaceae bacterium N1E253]|uniref:Uncharacterized protein n=2 Tax=Oceaniferula marina TaxID=2748318 RepID=A0A851GEJ0_9BACT|nr:hypothetical protein [Oceaniferula marina]
MTFALVLFGLGALQAQLKTEAFIKDGKAVQLATTEGYQEKDGRVWILSKKDKQADPVWSKLSLGRGNNIVEAQLQFHRRSDLYGKGVPSQASIHFGSRVIVLDGGKEGDILLKEEGKEDVVLGKTADFIKMKKLFKLKVARINGEIIIKINNKLVGKHDVKSDKGSAIGKVGLACNQSVMQVISFTARSQSFEGGEVAK